MDKQIHIVDDFDVRNGWLCVNNVGGDVGWAYQQCCDDWSKKCLSYCPEFGKIQEIKHFNKATGKEEVEKRIELCKAIIIREEGRRMSQSELEERAKKQEEKVLGLTMSLAIANQKLNEYRDQVNKNRE